MDNKQIYNVLKSHLNENKTQIKLNDDNYTIKSYVGNHICTITVSTKVGQKVSDKLLGKLNDDNLSLFKYSMDKNELCLSTSMWVDTKPTKQSMTEMITVLVSKLKSVEVLINNL